VIRDAHLICWSSHANPNAISLHDVRRTSFVLAFGPHAGIRAIVVRPADATSYIGSALHMTLFAIAGACQGTHVALEMRYSGDCLEEDLFMPFDREFWAAPSSPNVQPGLTALSATLTRLEARTVRRVVPAAIVM
jgi:hypothetical protein